MGHLYHGYVSLPEGIFDLDDLGQVFFLPSTCVTRQEVFSKELDAVYHDVAKQVEGGSLMLSPGMLTTRLGTWKTGHTRPGNLLQLAMV